MSGPTITRYGSRSIELSAVKRTCHAQTVLLVKRSRSAPAPITTARAAPSPRSVSPPRRYAPNAQSRPGTRATKRSRRVRQAPVHVQGGSPALLGALRRRSRACFTGSARRPAAAAYTAVEWPVPVPSPLASAGISPCNRSMASSEHCPAVPIRRLRKLRRSSWHVRVETRVSTLRRTLRAARE